MTTKTFFAAAVAAFAAVTTLGSAPAFASDAPYQFPAASASNVSRADVQAETLRARAAGEIAHGDRNVVVVGTGPALTRAQVKAETLEAIRLGVVDRSDQRVMPTDAQLESIRLAGLKAVDMTMASR